MLYEMCAARRRLGSLAMLAAMRQGLVAGERVSCCPAPRLILEVDVGELRYRV
jgi:hypothetical protein